MGSLQTSWRVIVHALASTALACHHRQQAHFRAADPSSLYGSCTSATSPTNARWQQDRRSEQSGGCRMKWPLRPVRHLMKHSRASSFLSKLPSNPSQLQARMSAISANSTGLVEARICLFRVLAACTSARNSLCITFRRTGTSHPQSFSMRFLRVQTPTRCLIRRHSLPTAVESCFELLPSFWLRMRRRAGSSGTRRLTRAYS